MYFIPLSKQHIYDNFVVHPLEKAGFIYTSLNVGMGGF
jgi:hypothetical protein